MLKPGRRKCKVYVAGPVIPGNEELRFVIRSLKLARWDVVSKWHGNTHKRNVEVKPLEEMFAIAQCDKVVFWSNMLWPGDDSFVALGYALVYNKPIVLIGPATSVYLEGPNIKQYDSWSDARDKEFPPLVYVGKERVKRFKHLQRTRKNRIMARWRLKQEELMKEVSDAS